jgi:Concanavalin A-like lectin/glucanases superfamily
MRKFTKYLILLFLVLLMGSCKINISGSKDDGEGGEEQNFLHDPYPMDNSFDVSLTPQLNWIYNSFSSSILFDVYMDTVAQPTKLIASQIQSNSYTIASPLSGNKTYYWKVKTLFEGNLYESNVWRFSTTAIGGILLNNPNPPDSATGISLKPQLSWNYSGSNYIYNYEIYMDTYNPPSTYIGQTSTPYYPITSPLVSVTTYYWKIKANTNNGISESNVWRFTTLGGLPTNGLMAYYPFNGNANDESGSLNHGQNNGATLTDDRFYNSQKAYWFNGSNSYINVTHSSSLQPTTGITLSAWVKFNTLSRAGSILVKGTANSFGMYSLRYDSIGQKLDFQINFLDYIQGQPKIVSSNTYLQTYQWYNVIGIFDGSYMKIYINGQSENSLYMPKTLGSNFSDLKIGRSAEGSFLNGDLDDIRIYNRALNDMEIQQLSIEGTVKKVAQLKHQTLKR